MAVNQQEEWLTSAETAEVLGLSVRTLEHKKFRQGIQTKLGPRPGRNPQLLYLRTSVEEFKRKNVRQRLISSRPSIMTRNFVFGVQEGAVTVTLPKQLTEQSLADALDFLKLVLRQLNQATLRAGRCAHA